MEESRDTTAKIIKKLHGGLISGRAECVELHTTLRRLATLLENSQFTKEEKIALHQCLLNVDGKEEFFLEPIAADKNHPLTLDELRQMQGEPVWVESKGFTGWAIILKVIGFTTDYVQADGKVKFRHANGYRKTWVAYRRKPEA